MFFKRQKKKKKCFQDTITSPHLQPHPQPFTPLQRWQLLIPFSANSGEEPKIKCAMETNPFSPQLRGQKEGNVLRKLLSGEEGLEGRVGLFMVEPPSQNG